MKKTHGATHYNHAHQQFQNWWDNEGKSIDPDTEDVSWFDKRKGLAERAFNTGLELGKAIAGNYTADDDTYPSEVNFANGRRVKLHRAANGKHYLTVAKF